MNSLEVQWLGLHALTAKGLGLISGQGTRIAQAVQCHQKKERKKKNRFHYCGCWLVLFLFCSFWLSFLCFVLPGFVWITLSVFRISFGLIWGVFECFSLRVCVFLSGCSTSYMGFPHSSVGKSSACNAGDPSSLSGLGRFPGGGNGNPLQYSCLENPVDRGAWQAAVHGIASQIRRSDEATT